MSFALRVAIVLALAAVLGMGIGLVINSRTDGSGSTTALPVGGLMGQATWRSGVRGAPDFTLPDQTGRATALSSFRGRELLLTFLDPRCLHACPRAARSLAASLRLLPEGARPAVVVVSRGRDGVRPALVRRAARMLGIDVAPGWRWLFGSRDQLEPVWRAYGVVAAGSSRRSVAYVIDRSGYERAGFLYPFPPNWLQTDIETLRREH